MPIFDIFVLVLVAIVLLGLAWVSEKVKDWLWNHVFKFLGFLFRTAIGLGVCLGLAVVLGIYVFTDWIPHLTLPEDQTPYWFGLMLWGMAVLAACSLAYSGIRRLFREEGSEQLVLEPVREPVRQSAFDEEYEPFPWGKVLKFEAVYMGVTTPILVVMYHLFWWDESLANWQHAGIGSLLCLLNLGLGFFLWLLFDAWLTARRERLQNEAYEREQEALRAERRLQVQMEAEREAQAEREAEAARPAEPPSDPWSDRTDAFNRPLMTPPERSDPFGSRLIPPNPASGGPTHSPAPGTRRMPPPNFGRPPVRSVEEEDMERHEPTPPRVIVGRREPVEDTGADRRPQRGWWKQNWRYVVGAMVVLALAGGGYWFWPKGEPSEQQKLVDQAAKMQAEDTLRTYMKADPVMSENCPNGWNDDCWRTLYDAKIELPPCVQVGRSQVNTTGASWWLDMDDRCIAEMVRQNAGNIKEAAARPSGEVEKFLFGTEINQRHAFEARDTARINVLLDDPALKREVILDFWRQDFVPWRILSHPSLTKGDLDGIYAEVQANGWYEAMPWLTINPNLDANLRGMWLMAPPLEAGEAGKTERERRVLLGLHQPNVPTGAVSFLVDQAVDEGNEGDLDLWKVLVKAAENGDLPAHRCRLSTDKAAEKDADKKHWPVCMKGQTWDFIAQMEWLSEQEGSPFASVPADWEALKYKCQWESAAGRHSGAVKNRAGKVTPSMSDASPANLPPEP